MSRRESPPKERKTVRRKMISPNPPVSFLAGARTELDQVLRDRRALNNSYLHISELHVESRETGGRGGGAAIGSRVARGPEK